MINVKRVKEHIPNILLILSFGSTNYGLRTPTSDYDYVVYVVPTLDDLYDRTKISRHMKIDGNDYEIKSIINLPDNIKGGSLKVLEVLGAKDKYINTKTDLWKWIDKNKHLLVKQEPVLRKLTKEINEKYWRLRHNRPVTETNEGYERQQLYGYDTKYLMHGMRLIYLRAAVFEEGRSYINAIDLSREVSWWSVVHNRVQTLLDIKENKGGLDNVSAAKMMESSLEVDYSNFEDGFVYSDKALLKDLNERIKKECKAWKI